MADDNIQRGQPSELTPGPAQDGTSKIGSSVVIDGPMKPMVRYGIYLAVILLFTVIWVGFLQVLGYSGLKPAIVAVVLGSITFFSTRSFLVDRFLKLPVTVESTPPVTDNYREVIETVVFVVVLVLLLKSFVAEAFQIPTGSMAETLYGYQKIVKCPTCDYRFPVNCSEEAENKDPNQALARAINRCTCPNCLQKIQFNGAGVAADSSYAQTADPGWNSGDRVLVAKFLYDLFGRSPNRLDVVVFKFPGESNMLEHNTFRERFPGSGPYDKKGQQINYIKRFIGESRETIGIQRGKLYSLSPEWGLTFDDVPDSFTSAEKDTRRRELWRYEYMHSSLVPDPDSVSEETARKYMDHWNKKHFKIVRKSPENILAMKRILNDHDFTPKDEDKTSGAPVRWAGTDWKPVGKSFTAPPTSAGQTAWLRYSHILRPRSSDETPEPELITDFMGYNAGVPLGGTPPTRGQNWVSDLILETEVEVTRAEGELVLELSKGIDRFQAHWNLGNGNCKLVRVRSGGKKAPETTELASCNTSVKRTGTYRLRFADVDQRLTVWVDKDLPFGDGVDDENPYEGGPVAANDLEPASIGVSNAAVTVRGLKLYRDTYYTTQSASDSGVNITNWGRSGEGGRSGWGEGLKTMPIRFLYVQPDHYLCMGDNSPNSSDGRTWGLVPSRLLLGRALLVYYPFYPFGPVNRIGRID
jgi:signal peptidase I